MKKFFVTALIAFGACGSALAADPYAAMYGNTVTITGSDGSKTTTFVNPDMTWEQHRADGGVVKGTYMWKDAATACFTQTDPAPKSADQATVCLPNQSAHALGDSWTVAGSGDKPMTVSITPGR